ncbi:peptide-methionine (S)-S-oxide reductase MsrA [Thiotrichales bacterium 19S9-12]|nr:peptide-methionine (S)-S-oxide reductase MsrA [Thiotrichales bacterium 19S9-11]MCF6810983.1 peptide-methionine (S)-S-oxide reductase MsrA [Thiotrichales bacterium 19S9-12]
MRIIIYFIILLFSPLMLYAKNIEKAIFSGGCFWCLEADFNHLKENLNDGGILKITPGYDGGSIKHPTYELVSQGKTNYREAVEVKFNPQIISYETLVKFFFQHIDPTVKDKQFCDIGKQYASAIYYTNKKQKQIATAILNEVKKKLAQKIYTEIIPSTKFNPAEEYHQQYYKKNPIRYNYYRWRCGRDQRIEAIWGSRIL